MALSLDRSTARQQEDWGLGRVYDLQARPLGRLRVTAASQEHGVIGGDPAALAQLEAGQRVRILPNHACLTAAAHAQYHVANADLEQCLDAVIEGAFSNAGQICSACTRLLVPASLHDRVVAALVARVGRLRVAPACEDPDMGPLISGEQQARALGLIRAAIDEGAVDATAAEHPALPAAGFFVAPTVLSGVLPTHAIAQTEVFGPVLSVMSYDTIDEAVTIANGTRVHPGSGAGAPGGGTDANRAGLCELLVRRRDRDAFRRRRAQRLRARKGPGRSANLSA